MLGYVCEDVKMAALAKRHRLKFAVMRAPDWAACAFVPPISRAMRAGSSLVKLWRGTWVVFTAAAWALWLPALVFLLARHQFAAALAWAVVPSVFLGAWYGWARAILAPVGIYAILPSLLQRRDPSA